MRVFASVVACCAPLVAHAGLDPDAMREYGGRYAVDCADPSKPRVVVTANTFAVEQGTQRMSGGALQASVSAFGQSPPDGFAGAVPEARRRPAGEPGTRRVDADAFRRL
jgi:hypothetical protein